MNRRVEIVSPNDVPPELGYARPLSPLQRIKFLLTVVLLVAVATGILIAGLILGSILAAVVLIIFVLAIAALILRKLFWRVRSGRRYDHVPDVHQKSVIK